MNVENSAHQRQEIPTHLEVEDRLVFGLTLRQGIVVLIGCALGYTLYAQLGHLPWPGAGSGGHLPLALRIAGACIPALMAFAVAAIQPAGRPLEEWLFALLRYAALPKHCVWRPHLNTSIGPIPVEQLDDGGVYGLEAEVVADDHTRLAALPPDGLRDCGGPAWKGVSEP